MSIHRAGDAAGGAAGRVLELARRDRAGAAELLRGLDLEQQLALVLELPVEARARLLELAPAPEALVPMLPEAELCFVAKSVGLADAGWILSCASDEQLQACLDLDTWKGDALDVAALDAWVESLEDAGEETLLRATRVLDPELVYAFLRARARARLKPNEPDFQPEPGEQTLEGQFYLQALREGDDLAQVLTLLRALFEQDYWLYFRMMQALIWEDPIENEEYARRWREGRLQDLGFPPWDEAMPVYAYLPPRERLEIPADAHPLDVEEWRLPMWIPRLPVATDARHLVFRAAAQLGDDERRAFFFAFVGLANRVAVADRMSLGDAESIPAAIDKSAVVCSQGLERLARHHGLEAVAVLRRVELERLFRVGASQRRDEMPEAGPGAGVPAREPREDGGAGAATDDAVE